MNDVMAKLRIDADFVLECRMLEHADNMICIDHGHRI